MLKPSPGAHRRVVAYKRRARELKMIAKGLASTDHPILAHIIPIRRCNLSCTYCNEYDDFSKPVAVEVMKARIDDLARLGTSIITFSGGEPLLHPELDDLIAHIRKHPILAAMITNGYLLTADRIKRLNRAGLDHLQISIDNVMPDEVSKKIAESAGQETAVAGGTCGLSRQHQFSSWAAVFTIRMTRWWWGRRAVQLGFTSTIGIIHDGEGQLQPLSEAEREVFMQMKDLDKQHYSRASTGFKTTSPTESRTSGAVGPVLAISTSARTGWSIIARNSAAIPEYRSSNIPSRTSAASSSPKKVARHTAPCPAYTRFRTWTTGALHRRFELHNPPVDAGQLVQIE